MSGIFGILGSSVLSFNDLEILAKHSLRRGQGKSGLIFYSDNKYYLFKYDYAITKLINEVKSYASSLVLGYSSPVDKEVVSYQSILKDGTSVIFDGKIINTKSLLLNINKKEIQENDSDKIAAIYADLIKENIQLEKIPHIITEYFEGIISYAIVLPYLRKLCLFSNIGSLYLGEKDKVLIFSSEKYPLMELGCLEIRQLKDEPVFLDIPATNNKIYINEKSFRQINIFPNLGQTLSEEKMLEYRIHNLRRCNKCLLPETMPFIEFDDRGVCNYCRNYKPIDNKNNVNKIQEILDQYRRKSGNDCIVPFSGGRDSSYALHVLVKEYKMKPIAFTYDWGMSTDIAQRNISKMCSALGIEHIYIDGNIEKKRNNVAKNLRAWLKNPHLGMFHILTAGDKHFFRYIEIVKKQTGISLNIWGTNPLEVTYFKAGFLGVPPDFEEKNVYSTGIKKQLRYQLLRFKEMVKNPGYFNDSLWDTITGEYYRSIHKKTDYYHLYDYIEWDENLINMTVEEYGWERAEDTKSTWRIDDGTAAFYNYVFYTIAGFTENDTFRSNQIREGDLKREEAMKLIIEENRPRYMAIKWYLDVIGFDFEETIRKINSIKKLY